MKFPFAYYNCTAVGYLTEGKSQVQANLLSLALLTLSPALPASPAVPAGPGRP